MYSLQDVVQGDTIDPKDVSQLTPTSENGLTLITCYRFGRSPQSTQACFGARAEG